MVERFSLGQSYINASLCVFFSLAFKHGIHFGRYKSVTVWDRGGKFGREREEGRDGDDDEG